AALGETLDDVAADEAGAAEHGCDAPRHAARDRHRSCLASAAPPSYEGAGDAPSSPAHEPPRSLTCRGSRATSRALPRPCPGGGIGRRAGFRYLWPQGRGSSSLLLGTNGSALCRDQIGEAAAMADVTQFIPSGSIQLHRHDLPEGLDLGPVVAVDTETMGLD